METPMISIILPIYKAEPYLRRCVDSILAQTYTNLEVILVDDGSPDGCPAICDEYAAKDRRVVVIHQKNAGVCAARNVGLNASRGDYFGFVDDDDWIEPDMYEVLYDAMRASGADLVSSYSCLGEGSPERVGADGCVVYSPHEAMRRLLDNQCDLTCVWGKLFDRSVAGSFRFSLDVAIAEDVLFNIDVIANSKKVAYVDYRCYHHVPNAHSVTHRFEPNYWSNLKAIDMIIGIVKDFDRDLGLYAARHVIALDVHIAKLAEAKGVLSKASCEKVVAHIRKYKNEGYWDALPFRKKCWARLLLLGRRPFLLGRRMFRLLIRMKLRMARGLR